MTVRKPTKGPEVIKLSAGIVAALLALFAANTLMKAADHGIIIADDPPSTTGTVVAVIDGDTIDVEHEGGTDRVRIIGIDTPEIGRRGAEDECYAQEARTIIDDLLYGETVELIPDPTQDDTDRYDRLLRHVEHDGTNVGLHMITVGAAEEFTFNMPYQDHADFIAAQQAAQDNRRGQWGACAN